MNEVKLTGNTATCMAFMALGAQTGLPWVETLEYTCFILLFMVMELDFFQARPQVSVAISFGATLAPTLALYLPINCVAEIAVGIKARTQAQKLKKSTSDSSSSARAHSHCDELWAAPLHAHFRA